MTGIERKQRKVVGEEKRGLLKLTEVKSESGICRMMNSTLTIPQWATPTVLDYQLNSVNILLRIGSEGQFILLFDPRQE